MTIEREYYNGPISFLCDHASGCSDVCETEHKNFHDALVDMKAEKWRVYKSGDKWLHMCTEHSQP